MTGENPVLVVRDLHKHFAGGSRLRGGRHTVRAVDGVDLTIAPGEVLGLVGESGSGKSTVGRCIARLETPTSGTVELLGRDVSRISRREMRPVRRDVHVVFQDPYSSLNPRMTVGQIVGEPLRQHGEGERRDRTRRVGEMLERVGLREQMRTRYPHELSGGQRQRVALARALVLGPRLLVADEPVSALDVSVQASILNLFLDLQHDLGFSCLFITHDLSVVEFISDRIAVMYLGRIVETASRETLFADPQHPYTQALLSAAPAPDPADVRRRERIVLSGDLPSPSDPPSGCRFHTRCPVAIDRCATDNPPLTAVTAPDHPVACHLVTAESGRPRVAAP
ncbi:ABC transporter ATP-binding protein [Pseudonocardia sp. CA-142604]|uniref:ABC transporter ATP-binding protein n=1 Tax=Pseudonocardia sp. CA-142604 TaxID=3240024 RepID=UPI003D8D1241